MTNAPRKVGVLVGAGMLLGLSCLFAQDWPQWRGPERNARVTGFKAPKTWPKELTQRWKITVGEGVATPALVGDKLYVFSRQEGQEILRCLDAASGKEVWQDKYAAEGATGPARGFSGPRSSPVVADGKVVTLGVRGVLSCLDAASGKKLWRKDESKSSLPRFFTSSSPLVVDNLCIAQLGGEGKGAIVAYDLTSGDEKWKWTGDGTSYASPMLDTVNGAKEIVAETTGNIVGLNVADGKLLWKTAFKVRYNACTPIVDGSTIIYSGAGGGTKAVKIEKQGEEQTAKELWSNKDNAVQFNTPVLKDGLLFGLSSNNALFCMSAKDGKTAWSKALPGTGRDRGYGSIVDAGSVLLALTPAAQLIVLEPSDKEFKQLAAYKVANGGTYAYPVLAGNRIYIKDSNALTLWSIE
jgi:outer membrane protein assembly factor BamB